MPDTLFIILLFIFIIRNCFIKMKKNPTGICTWMIFYTAKSNRPRKCDKAVLVNKSTDNNIIYTF